MKKIFISLLIAMFLLPTLLAINLEVEKISANEVMIVGINQPAVFEMQIKNNGGSDNFQFYNLLGFNMAPKGTVPFGIGETKNVTIMIYPREDLQTRNFYNFQYYIRGEDSSEETEELTVKIIELKNAFEIGADEFDPESSSVQVYLHNKENFNFEKINAKLTSAFFDINESFSLAPHQRKNFEIKLNKEDFKKITAGFYTLNAQIQVEDEEADLQGTIRFVEKDIVTSTSKDYGLIVSTKVIRKENQGNVVAQSETLIKKNIFSRLFTSFSPEPDFAERSGAIVEYTWNRQINPGDALEITVKTNWLFPLLLVFFIVVIVILAKLYVKRDLSLRKQITFVRAKGGEFALKVSIVVRSKKYIENVNIVDRLPPLVKVFNRFGGEAPKRIDEKRKRIEWSFEKLEEGEIRILSYLIYSKVGVLGKFALPSTTAIYEKDGEIHETVSNKTYFVAEQKDKGDEFDE